MTTAQLVVLVLVILLLAGGPWGHHSYGLWPSGGLGLVLLIVLILVLLGKL